MSSKISGTASHNRTLDLSDNLVGRLYTKARENDYWNKITEYN